MPSNMQSKYMYTYPRYYFVFADSCTHTKAEVFHTVITNKSSSYTRVEEIDLQMKSYESIGFGEMA